MYNTNALLSTTERKDMISKEYILDRVSEYSIYAKYIGDFKIGSLYKSPLREDNNPSFGIFISHKTGRMMYKDFSNGEYGNVFDFVKKYLNLSSFRGAVERISFDLSISAESDYKLEKGHRYEPKTKVISVTRKKFNLIDLDFWGKFGITEETLKKYKVAAIDKYFVDKKLKMTYSKDNPMYCYKVFNHFKIYRPLGKKIEKWRSSLTSFDIQGYEQLSATADLLIITKSLKDVMVLRELGLEAVAPPAEGIMIPQLVIDDLKRRFKRIVVLYDRDKAGMIGARRLVNQYKLDFMFIEKKLKTKDVSDFVAKYGLAMAKAMLSHRLSN